MLIPSSECVPWRLSREMWKWDPTAVSGSGEKAKSKKRKGEKRNARALWDSSVGPGGLYGKNGAGKPLPG